MLISKIVMVRWNGYTRNWYENKGYIWTKQNDSFKCKIEDVQINSTIKVEAKCDYCNETYYPEYRRLLDARKTINKDCCNNRQCMIQKSKEVTLAIYSAENVSQLELYRENARKREQTPFYTVEEAFINKNLQLLSVKSDYQNDKSRLFFICNNHKEQGIQETNYANIKKNKGCCNYGKGELCAKSSKLDGYLVYDAFIKKGLIPIFSASDYNRINQQLPYLCPNHKDKGIQYRNYATLQTAKHLCDYCFREYSSNLLRIDENIVFDYYKERGLTICKGEQYLSKDINIKYCCDKHTEYIQQVSYSGLKNTKQPCDYCRAEESLTKLNKRLRSSITQWVKDSKDNCQNMCIFTHSKKYDVHHLKSSNEIIKEALFELGTDVKDKYSGEEFVNIKNKVIELHNKYPLGVCISNPIHVLFHQLYSKESSIRDFEEFKKRYFNGEFKDILL